MVPALLLLSCAARLGASDAPVPEVAPQDPTPPALQAPIQPPATLVAEPCGVRPWVREIDLEADNYRFTARDLVSPCPPGVQCVWSGIAVRTGTAEWRDGVLVLSCEDSGPPGVPFPERMAPAGPDALQDEEGCVYRVRSSGPR
ncbi:MAG: hypothetical protein JXB39_03365 [Deltaproteobacteria bacterium]|nr:hypothetical protein [Deltaproteobacteria bacterium]